MTTTTSSELLPNFFAGRWQVGQGAGTPLFDPVLGTELVRVSNTGIDLAEGFAFAREHGGAALRALSYGQRAGLLAKIVEVLQTGALAVTQGAQGCAAVFAGKGKTLGQVDAGV